MHKLRRNDLIEPELSYQIVGAIFTVYNEVGPGLKENVYQRALAEELRAQGIAFRAQVHCPIYFRGKPIGHRYLDFLVADKIIVELKSGDHLPRAHVVQVKEYLMLMKLQLAILASITHKGARFKRIINLK